MRYMKFTTVKATRAVNPTGLQRGVLQILSVAAIVLIWVLVVDPLFYREFFLSHFPELRTENTSPITSVSLWTFAFTLSYWIYPNKFLTNFLLASWTIITGLVVVEFYRGFFNDFFHLIPVVVGLLVMRKYRGHIERRLAMMLTALLALWIMIDWKLGLNYHFIKINVFWISILVFWFLSSYTISTLLTKSRTNPITIGFMIEYIISWRNF